MISTIERMINKALVDIDNLEIPSQLFLFELYHRFHTGSDISTEDKRRLKELFKASFTKRRNAESGLSKKTLYK